MRNLHDVLKGCAGRLNQHIENHERSPNITLLEHVRKLRLQRAARARTKRLIYLDTNAWKCMADYRLQKEGLKPAMLTFGSSLERAAKSGVFAFPIALPTLFELDSITGNSRDQLAQLVDELSFGLCVIPLHDRFGIELQQIRSGKNVEDEGLEDFICSPIELYGIPVVSLPEFVQHVDAATFNKSFFDTLAEQPISVQLDLMLSAPGAKWNNSKGVDELNAGKIEQQGKIVNLNTGIFVELRSCIESWFDAKGIDLSQHDISLFAAKAMEYWQRLPLSKAYPTLRVLSSLHGLMRFDPSRRFKAGDPNDFMIAASALPIAEAFFTDRKLAAILRDPKLGLLASSKCEVVSGFEDMAAYLESNVT